MPIHYKSVPAKRQNRVFIVHPEIHRRKLMNPHFSINEETATYLE
jgi:hypothetical protein